MTRALTATATGVRPLGLSYLVAVAVNDRVKDNDHVNDRVNDGEGWLTSPGGLER